MTVEIDKSLLLNDIRLTKENLEVFYQMSIDVEKLKAEYEEIYMPKKPTVGGTIVDVAISTVIGCIILFAGGLFFTILNETLASIFITGVLLGYLYFAGSYIIKLIKHIINPRIYENKLKEEENKKEQAKSTYEGALQIRNQTGREIVQNTIIPVKYITINALNKFEEYLMNYRADTLKECINLFEQEVKSEQLREQLHLANLIQEQQLHAMRHTNAIQEQQLDEQRYANKIHSQQLDEQKSTNETLKDQLHEMRRR